MKLFLCAFSLAASAVAPIVPSERFALAVIESDGYGIAVLAENDHPATYRTSKEAVWSAHRESNLQRRVVLIIPAVMPDQW